MAIRAVVLVTGRVQGIGYRYFVSRNARRLGLNGFVKNLDDGRVQAVFEGEKEVVEKMLNTLKDHPFSKVTNVETNFEKPKNEFDGFSIEY